MYYWTARNNNSGLNSYRTANTLQGAVRAARQYVMAELYGEGEITVYQGEPTGRNMPLRQDARGIATNYRWTTK